MAELALLSLAEGFRTSNPPDIPSTVQCLLAILNLRPIATLRVASTNLQIAKLLLQNAPQSDSAVVKGFLEKALQNTVPHDLTLAGIRWEAASLLASTFDTANQTATGITLLQKCMEQSYHSVFWHCKLSFQLASYYAKEKDYTNAAMALSNGAEYAQKCGCHYTRILFLLSRGMALMIDRKLTEGGQVLNVAGQLVENWQGDPRQKENLKVFFLVLQVCHHLNSGQVKSVKSSLKLLQQSIQTITSYQEDSISAGNQGDAFLWMSKEHLCILVYLVTVLHSMQAGYMDKAQKFTEKALMQIEKLRATERHPMLDTFQVILLEHIAMCRVTMGNCTLAVKETIQAWNICGLDSGLQSRHKPVINTLLGLYAMAVNSISQAESQFTTVLRSSSISSELRILVSLNLSIVYLRMNRERELKDLLVNINPERFPSHSQSLKAAAFYVMGLNAFFQGRYPDAKRCLRETLKMANAEDLNRLTSISLVLLGHIFYSLGSHRESMNMVTPAMQLASKIPDIHVQCWATALLKDLYHLMHENAREQEYVQMHQHFSQQLYSDQCQSSQQPEHSYINWLGEENNSNKRNFR